MVEAASANQVVRLFYRPAEVAGPSPRLHLNRHVQIAEGATRGAACGIRGDAVAAAPLVVVRKRRDDETKGDAPSCEVAAERGV